MTGSLRQTARRASLFGLLAAAACSADEEGGAELPSSVASASSAVSSALLVPNDPYYSLQWNYPAIRLPEAWQLTTGTPNIRIAILDTGRAPHPDLDSKWVQGLEYDALNQDGVATNPGRTSHASHVAGIAAGRSNNGEGGAGVCWGCQILNVPVTDTSGQIDATFAVVARGIDWAVDNGAQVINLSLGSNQQTTLPCSDPQYATLRAAITAARNRNVVVVAAAGNYARNASGTVPASCSGVISVAATDRNNALAGYSNYGAVTLAAPGGGGVAPVPNQEFGAALGCPADPPSYFTPDTEGVVSAWSTSGGAACYRYLSGTSMAAPHVAGVIGLMLSRNPTLTAARVQEILETTATPIPSCSGQCGRGLIDAAAAVAAAAPLPVNDAPPVARFTAQCTGLNCTFDASTSTDDRGIVAYQWMLPGTQAGPAVPLGSQPGLHLRTGGSTTYFMPGFGNHVVRLRVVDATGQSHELSQTVTAIPDVSVPRAGSFSPLRSGSNLVIHPTGGGNWFVGWFTYESDGRGGADPVWYNAGVGPISGARFSQPLFRYTQSRSAPSPTETRVGTLSLDFSGAGAAWVSWVINGIGGGERYLRSDSGSGKSGVWYPPAEPGWGITLEEGFYLNTYVSFYFNDQPRWMTSFGWGSSPSYTLSYTTGPGLCPSCGGKGPIVYDPSFSPPSSPSTIALQIPNGSSSGTATVNIYLQTMLGIARIWTRNSPTVAIQRLTLPGFAGN